ncbi:MAG TPA: hypothetical protein VG847_10350 [Chitinophagaceae bacterium]|nr:hypothetical protein [Chitinophagaceae bacterium]
MARAQNAYTPPFSEMMLYRNPELQQKNATGANGSKIRTINSGIAANAAAALRSGINAIVPAAASETLQKRFAQALTQWLGTADADKLPACENISALTDFQITSGHSFSDRFNVPVTIHQTNDSKLTVGINAFTPTHDVSAPEGTVLLEVVFATAGCFLNTGISTGAQVMRIQVPYGDSEIAAQSLHFKVPSDKGVLIVTGAWLQYYTGKRNGIERVERAEFLPSNVLKAQYR